MTKQPTDTPGNIDAKDKHPQIDAKKTDRKLPSYFSNSFTRYSDFTDLANSAADFRDLLGGVMKQRLAEAGVDSPEEFDRQAQEETTEDPGS